MQPLHAGKWSDTCFLGHTWLPALPFSWTSFFLCLGRHTYQWHQQMSRSPEPVSCLPLLPAPIISVNDFPRIGGGQHTSSVKSQIVNIFSFVNHVLSALTTQFCNCREPAAVENTETKEHGCVQIKLYLQKQMTGCIRPTSCSLPTSVREQPPCGLAQGPW